MSGMPTNNEPITQSRRRVLQTSAMLGVLGIAGCIGTNGGGNGGEFPSKDLRYIVPFSEGGGTDTYARSFQSSLSDASGQSIVVDNIEGAGSLRGTEEAFRAEPDGHTFIGFNPPATPTTWLIHQPQWDIREFEGIAYIGRTAYVLIANSDYGIEGLEDLQQRYESGEFSALGGQEPGHLYHIAALLFQNQLGIPWKEYVAFPGTGPIVQAVISDEVPAGIATDTGALSAVEDGRADVVAVLHSDGSSVFPETETVTEQGFGNIDHAGGIFRGIYAPPDTPSERVEQLSSIFEEAANSDEVGQWSEDSGNDVSYGGPDEVNEILNDSIELIQETVDIESVREGATD